MIRTFTAEQKIDLINKLSFFGYMDTKDPTYLAIGYICSPGNVPLADVPEPIKGMIEVAMTKYTVSNPIEDPSNN